MDIKFKVFMREDTRSLSVAEHLISEATALGFTYDEVNPHFIFTVGGDGTFLKAVHAHLKALMKITFIGIHTGSLGFFADFHVNDIPNILNTIKMGDVFVKDYRLVRADIFQRKTKRTFYAVNEVKVENVHHTLVLDVWLNDLKLETYRGNGILVASQLGSSGYNKSLGGAIINRDLELLEYTKIGAISNSVYRPLVNPLILGPKDVLIFTGHNAFTFFGHDHLTKELADIPFTIKVSLSNKKVKIMHNVNRPYPTILNEAFLGGK